MSNAASGLPVIARARSNSWTIRPLGIQLFSSDRNSGSIGHLGPRRGHAGEQLGEPLRMLAPDVLDDRSTVQAADVVVDLLHAVSLLTL